MRTIQLGEVVDITQGFAFDSELFGDEGDLPLVRIRDVVPGRSRTFLRGGCDPRYLVNNGDILIGMDGEFNCARWHGGQAALNQRVCRVRPADGAIDDGYLYRLLPRELKRIEEETPFVTVKHLSAKQLRAAAIPFPSLAEQRRIAAILDEADALRAKRRAALAQLDEMARAIFVEMFGTPPYSQTMALGDCVEEFRYGTSEKSAAHGRPTLRIPNVIGGRVDLTDLKLVPVDEADFRRLRLRGGDVLFVRTNGNPENVGRCAAITDDLGADCGLSPADFVYASYLIRARLRPEKLEPTFLCAFLAGEAGRNHVREHAKTSAGQFNINTDGLGAIRIPAADLAQQRAFAMRLDGVTATRTDLLRHSKTLDSLFASLQHRAFRGEL